jgi:hypothetical protein
MMNERDGPLRLAIQWHAGSQINSAEKSDHKGGVGSNARRFPKYFAGPHRAVSELAKRFTVALSDSGKGLGIYDIILPELSRRPKPTLGRNAVGGS